MTLKIPLKHLFPSLILLLAVGTAVAQHPRRETLTPAEIESVRESAEVPDERVKLYTKFTEERADRVKDLTRRPKTGARVQKLDDALQDLTALMDELGSNLDVYSDRRSDIRKSLKLLADAAPRWLQILRVLPGETGFDLSRKEAIESGEELADQASRLLHEQTDYFTTHKDERGQERNDPALTPKPQF
jgi:hypothetical protein